ASLGVAQKRLRKVQRRYDRLKDLTEDANKALRDMNEPQLTDELQNADSDKRIVKHDEARKFRNNLDEYEHKVQTLLAAAENNVKDLEGSLDALPANLKGMQERVAKAADALTELQEDARRHANVFTAWLLNLKGMKKARAAARGGKSIEEAAK